jgi:uncharacterized membrane-anchored protein
MKNKVILFSIFLVVIIIQLFVPAKIIFDSEDILNTGIEFKFRTAPIDPNDPFRGKFIFLQYKENTINVENEKDWELGETVFVILDNDENGFAKLKSVTKSIPVENTNFVKAKIASIYEKTITINYSFDRFYMEETKAPKAEQVYNESLADSTTITFGLVAVKDGNAILKDIIINDTSITKLINPIK